MEKEYREMFDEVHASERLRTEVMNMKHAETAKRYRIPRAALIAAVLAAVLAGTALAAELLGRIQIDLKNPDETNTSGEGYTGEAAMQTIPVESLSAAALERAAEMEDIVGSWKFDSWAEAEAFLGLELLDNPKLDELPPAGSCGAMVINYTGEDQQHRVPFFIILSAAYQADGCRITQAVDMKFGHPGGPQGETSLGLAKHSGETHLEEYTTPSGIEASIVTTTEKRGASKAVDYTSYIAYWVADNVLYSLCTSVHDPIGHPDATHALEILKEVLDAYE